MVKRKRKKHKVSLMPLTFGSRKKRKTHADFKFSNLFASLKIAAVICVSAGIIIGFVYLEKYVKKIVRNSEKTAFLELVNPPDWVNEAIKGQIFDAATAGGEDLKLDDDLARSVQKNIEAFTGWIDEVKVQTTSESLQIEGRWRMPVALVKRGLRKFYVDSELVVLDFVPMDNLPIIKVEGISASSDVPPTGKIWQADDLAAAVAILNRLKQRDELEGPGCRLLYEIDRINVSNFNGRQNSRYSHIILYTTENTEIIWGAELEKWQQHLEATNEQKIARLYSYYKEKGSLLGGVKYINLKDPQQTIPLPIDKY